MQKKVFGIISYFPNSDTAYHTEMRTKRTKRFFSMLYRLEELWPTVDIIIIAQNWQGLAIPDIHNKVTIYHYPKLGILNARRELRKKFLDSEYDYLIMLDDDFIISSSNPQAFLTEIDKHPDGFGAIRLPPSPLPFFSISKYIYNQIDMPDIDPEKGEGFEDDIFSAICFAKFPERGFMFPEGLAHDASFHYKGPGECPSTWSRESKYDWSHMRSYTKAIIANINAEASDSKHFIVSSNNVSASMDLVIPYVNASDTTWQQSILQHTKTAVGNNSSVRFRSWGTLRYLFRGVDKYMPFINRIVLILASPTQLPIWVNPEKVRIVYHEEFIPKKFLPTFNSCTIESFLFNIEGLSDRFIYANDDMFPINMCTESDFFTGDKPNLKFVIHEKYSANATFRCQCRSGLDLISSCLNLPTYDPGYILRPYHITQPMTVSCLQQVKSLCQDVIGDTISPLRLPKNVNQYIYAYYQYFTNNYVNSVVDYKYFEITDRNMPEITDTILSGKYKLVCLNDSSKLSNYRETRGQLISIFKQKFPNRCQYEQ